jgi:hypothetical protein
MTFSEIICLLLNRTIRIEFVGDRVDVMMMEGEPSPELLASVEFYRRALARSLGPDVIEQPRTVVIPPELQTHIEWFQSHRNELPNERFQLHPWACISIPRRFYMAIDRAIEMGAGGVDGRRMRSGALEGDIAALRSHVESKAAGKNARDEDFNVAKSRFNSPPL